LPQFVIASRPLGGRRSNPSGWIATVRFAPLAMTEDFRADLAFASAGRVAMVQRTPIRDAG
jgi:hypothetical protein